ncbi:hypothetical protein TNIN_115591 [Trichonephila inaurata madagascariensis]|uniref:THAP-type domain-containing protein n=1 Tax=Trichonephila inaurata madagascariensis TaxID=2747483 RepID=A0A8X7C2L1_9ARAC|nr:hypothetical protein TNIN_115591 [Trichonephila inaurata madagascariensis]
MVHTCVVPNCNSNYKGTGTLQMFGFLKEDSLRKKWMQAISRKDFAPSKFMNYTFQMMLYEDTPKLMTKRLEVTVPLKRFRLQNFAAPTIFKDFPTYLSNSANPARESPEQKLQRLENEHLQRSIQANPD